MSRRGAAFRTVSGAPRIARNAFDLSSERRFTCDMFQLIPVMVEDVLPGDNWRISAECIVRMNPLAVPVMHEVNMSAHYFFLPYRMLYEKWRLEDPATRTFDWEQYYTGGEDGHYNQLPPVVDVQTAPSSYATNISNPNSLINFLYSLYVPYDGSAKKVALVSRAPDIAYNMIYNEYYRDQTLVPKVPLQQWDWLYRSWEKDYFTSALPWQQRGTAPALPVAISGGHAIFDGGVQARAAEDGATAFPNNLYSNVGISTTAPPGIGVYNTTTALTFGSEQNYRAWMNQNHIEASPGDIATFDINTLRLTVQTQKWLERNARTGARYTEHLRAHFHVAPRDDRLQRPEYIGGMRSPIIVSEVLQTSQTTPSTSPAGASSLGAMGGHGIMADRSYCGSKFVEEPGIIMGLLSIMPTPVYMNQGVDRQWTKRSRYDEYMSEFIHLGEQAIKLSEIWAQQQIDPDNEPIFGYQGRYNEYRYRRNTVHGLMLTDYVAWHMARKFATRPYLNKDFVQANEQERQALKRGLAAPSEPMFLVTYANVCPNVVRPLPWLPDPGMLDHY